ncbi:MAG: hypothetical protein RIQ37_435, partial [Actinomycetota bacterium]
MSAKPEIPEQITSWTSGLESGNGFSKNVLISPDESFDVLDPGTARKLVTLPVSNSKDVARAVNNSRQVFESGVWRNENPDNRERVLLRLADLVERDFSFLSTVEALDTGKPLAEAEFDIQEVATVLRYYGGWCNKVTGQSIATPTGLAANTLRGPVGVCAAITPWNYPLPILMYKLAPALAFGNSFVAKPSELAPLSTIYFAQLCEEAGVPSGVVTVLLGAGKTGADLVANPVLDKVAFTGSTKTGRAIMSVAANNITKVSLELGGKSPQVVFESADLEKAVEGVARGIWTNSGQVCVAGSRLLIQRSLKERFLGALLDFTQNYNLGHSLNPHSQMGPIISASQKEKIQATLDAAKSDGAEIFNAGTLTTDEGFFLKPTIVDGLDFEHSIHQEEIFGPVISVTTFDSESDAIELANSTRYGLAAGVWTGKAGQGQRVARAI